MVLARSSLKVRLRVRYQTQPTLHLAAQLSLEQQSHNQVEHGNRDHDAVTAYEYPERGEGSEEPEGRLVRSHHAEPKGNKQRANNSLRQP